MTGCVALLCLHVAAVVIPIQTTGFYNLVEDRRRNVELSYPSKRQASTTKVPMQCSLVMLSYPSKRQASTTHLQREQHRECCHTHPNNRLLQRDYSGNKKHFGCHTHPNDRLLQQYSRGVIRGGVVIPIQTTGFYNPAEWIAFQNLLSYPSKRQASTTTTF